MGTLCVHENLILQSPRNKDRAVLLKFAPPRLCPLLQSGAENTSIAALSKPAAKAAKTCPGNCKMKTKSVPVLGTESVPRIGLSWKAKALSMQPLLGGADSRSNFGHGICAQNGNALRSQNGNAFLNRETIFLELDVRFSCPLVSSFSTCFCSRM